MSCVWVYDFGDIVCVRGRGLVTNAVFGLYCVLFS